MATQDGARGQREIPTWHAERILQEWKVNVELQRLHEGLKHERLKHFLTMQTVLFALAGLAVSAAYNAKAWVIALLAVVGGLGGAMLVVLYRLMDLRARAYVDVVKGRQLLLENEWNEALPTSRLDTFHQQWAVLVHHDPAMISKYLGVRGLKRDRLADQLKTRPAHLRESAVFWVFLALSTCVAAVGVSAAWNLFPR